MSKSAGDWYSPTAQLVPPTLAMDAATSAAQLVVVMGRSSPSAIWLVPAIAKCRLGKEFVSAPLSLTRSASLLAPSAVAPIRVTPPLRYWAGSVNKSGELPDRKST